MFDRVVVSTDEYFKNFVPIVCQSWRKYFPEAKIDVAFVTERNYQDPVVDKIARLVDSVKIFSPISNVPTKNAAKMSRFIYASEMGSQVCMIEDVDTIPLQRDFFKDRTSLRQPTKMLAVGQEVYAGGEHSDSFPISTMTAEGFVYKNFFNSRNLSWEQLFAFWKQFDPTIMSEDFSDEKLIAKLRGKFHLPVQNVERDVEIREQWIDRSWWHVDAEKLWREEYVCCNFKRPFEAHLEEVKDIVPFIYGRRVKGDEIVLE